MQFVEVDRLSAPLILVLNGPNLNLLGTREPQIYGTDTLEDIRLVATRAAEQLGCALDFRQSNHEGVLIDWIQEARGRAAGIIINAGAYTHTSIALLDALKAVDLPVIEVHLSNIFHRESFRHTSYPGRAAIGVIAGFGGQSYVLAVAALANLIKAPSV